MALSTARKTLNPDVRALPGRRAMLVSRDAACRSIASVIRRAVLRVVGGTVLAVVVLALLLLGLFWHRLYNGIPQLDGTVRAAVKRPVTIARDAEGVPTITGDHREDVAFATGFLHAQERYFQMDLLRRVAAGELSGLVGAAALPTDAQNRLHLFRARARAAVRRFTQAERGLISAYVAGVNRGLAGLRAPPFEYALLGKAPAPWRAEDSLLVVYAMYLDLQGWRPGLEIDRAEAAAQLGRPMADLLFPPGGAISAALDGSVIARPPLPERLGPLPASDDTGPATARPVKGSNNWAVAGRLTATGAAMVANDMHLGLRIPNTWYRVRLQVRAGGSAARDMVGVTLPGTPQIVVGSNGHVAWGFTNSYIDSRDAVIVEAVPGRPGWYRTPAGPRREYVVRQHLCAGAACRTLDVRNTIWGPIVGKLPDGRDIADRWTAHDPYAIRFGSFLAFEGARTVADGLAFAHATGLPQQNIALGDSAGHVAWTIAGQVPRRFGFDGRDAASWADGTRGWAGYLPADAVPAVVDPPGGRIWSANTRMVGGAAFAKLGDGGYDDGARAREIRDRLFARDRFAAADMLAIQTDTTAVRERFWQAALLHALARHRREPRYAAMVAPVRGWNGRADPASTGYRLIRAYRLEAIGRAYAAYLPDDTEERGPPHSGEMALRRLLVARPAGLVSPGARSWDGFEDAVLAAVAEAVDAQAGGDLARFTYGAIARAGIRHPLAAALPLLGRITDPAEAVIPGDTGTVRAAAPGFGSSERLVVSPGHEAEGLFEMPGGQSGAPLAPYYLAAHEYWVEGRAHPLLPGPTKWRLVIAP